jgi:3-hydroxybutyryl-CoA dehydrogenase
VNPFWRYLMEVSRVAVVGAGVMGSQIAQVMAMAGLQVNLRDVDQALVDRALQGIAGNLQKFFVEKGKLTEEQASEVRRRLRGTVSLEEAVQHVDLVVESIPEKIDLKKALFGDLDRLTRPDAILATNTSALSITDIASATGRPHKVIGMHFFNPVAVMKLVEIVRGAHTDEDTVESIKSLSARLGKETVVIKDTPGFITSRMVSVIINEAACMLAEGIASPEDIDKAIKLGLGHPMGPLELADYTNGVGIVWENMTYMMQEFGDPKYRPSYLLTQMVRSGRLGRKTGRGFYDYTKGQ